MINEKSNVINEELIEAVTQYDINKVKQLLEQEADVNFKDEDALPAIFYSITSHQIEMTRLLLDNGADPDIIINGLGETPYRLMLRTKCTEDNEIVKFLEENSEKYSIKVMDVEPSVFFKAVEAGNIPETKRLLTKHPTIIDIRDRKNCDTALHIAARNFNEEMVKLLIEHGASINLKNWDGDTPLGDARGHLTISKFLIEHGSSLELTEGNNIVHRAASINAVKLMKYLIEIKAPLNTKNEDKQTPLDIACINKHADMINLLSQEIGIAGNLQSYFNDECTEKKVNFLQIEEIVNKQEVDSVPLENLREEINLSGSALLDYTFDTNLAGTTTTPTQQNHE
ncbi:MAG: hypothetical protein RLZZ81_752 [Pseudomonadota bacterium]|jgi:ankyrin repeat protein